jgi:hypothetical protein
MGEFKRQKRKRDTRPFAVEYSEPGENIPGERWKNFFPPLGNKSRRERVVL